MKVENRIKKQKDFENILNFGKRIKSDQYSLSFKKNEFGYTRIGVSIPTKMGNAVIRNKVKRQIKAIISSSILLDSPLDVVIIARKDYSVENFLNNKQALLELFKKTGAKIK